MGVRVPVLLHTGCCEVILFFKLVKYILNVVFFPLRLYNNNIAAVFSDDAAVDCNVITVLECVMVTYAGILMGWVQPV